MSAGTANHENSISGENLPSREASSSSSCSKMLLPEGSSSASNLAYQQQSSSIPTISANAHCSIGQQNGSNSGLAPIMEIREMSNYCAPGISVGSEKYHWNHHHSHANVVRHPSVYPQMFYTPPPHTHSPVQPPASGNYAGSSSSGGAPVASSNDWNCPPSTVDSYSHFIYSQYAPPPPSAQHHDYSSYIGITTSCYDQDMMMLSNVSGPTPQIPIQNSCDTTTVPVSAQPIMNPFMYPAPLPPPPPLPSFDPSLQVPTTSVLAQKRHSQVENKMSESYSGPPPLQSTCSSSSSGETSDESDDDESKHIISIEDDDNDNIVDADMDSSCASPSSALPSIQCVLCKKPASLMAGLPQNAPSPQLSRILDNIDDDELDISVCSGDIEIGGIEDEMIQQVTEQQQQRVSLAKLSHLMGITMSELAGHIPEASSSLQDDEIPASLCFKCQRLVALAESLEKQLSSVLTTLRQVTALEDDFLSGPEFRVISCKTQSIAVQTEVVSTHYESNHLSVHRLEPLCRNIYPSNAPSGSSNNVDHVEASTPGITSHCLCHICGRIFNCRRNLGKHLKRYHRETQDDILPVSSRNQNTCPREACGKSFEDKAALRIHLRTHTTDKSYFCINCLQLFTSRSNLNAHIKGNICLNKLCDSTENLEISLTNTSTKENTEQMSFRCENCGLTFRTEARYQKHTRNTANCSKLKVFPCQLCPQVFAKRSELNVHLSVHTGSKPFHCDICGLGFSTKGNQRVHQRTHFTEKRFKCRHCNKGFTRNLTLQSHIANVHK